MDDLQGAKRVSVLGDSSPPNTSRRGVAVIVAILGIGALILVALSTYALNGWVERWGSSGAPGPAAMSRSARARSVFAVDPTKANARLSGNPALAFGADSYPLDAIHRSEHGRTVARLTVDTTGTPIGCVVTTSSGSASLDSATCRIALADVRYQPARDEEGRAIASTTTLPVRWVLPTGASLPGAASIRPTTPWMALLFAGVCVFQAVSLRRGFRTGRMRGPRGLAAADRRLSPRLFALYAALNVLAATVFGGLAVFTALVALS